MQKIELAYNDFRGGVNSRSARGDLKPNEARRIRNLEPVTGKGASLTLVKTSATIFDVSATPARCVFRYVNSSGTKYLIAHLVNNNVVAQNESVAWAPTVIGTSADTAARFLLSLDGTLLWTNGNNPLQAWYGVPATAATNAGVPAPGGTYAAYCQVSLTGTGIVDGTGKTRSYYQAVMTFVNNRGVEGPPSAASSVVYPVNQQIRIDCSLSSSISDIPTGVTKVRFYLFGGDIGDYYYVGEDTIHPADGSGGSYGTGYPNPVSRVTFNSYDSEVSTVLLNRNRVAPPSNMDLLVARQNRAWMAKTGTLILYFSGYNSYENTSLLSEQDAYDGGYITLTGGADDGVVALASFATLLVVGRQRSVYVLYGNEASQFSMSKRADIGVPTRDSIAIGPRNVYFAGTDRRIRRLTEGEPIWISENIQDQLDAISAADWATLKLVWWNERLILTTLNNAVSYIFYEEFQCWCEDTDLACKDIRVLQHPSTGIDEVLIVPTNGNTIKRCFTTTAERTVTFTSNEFRFDKEGAVPSDWTSFDQIVVEGSVGAPAVAGNRLAFTGYYINDGGNGSKTFLTTAYSELILSCRCPRTMLGHWVYFTLTGNISSGYINFIGVQLEYHRGAR